MGRYKVVKPETEEFYYVTRYNNILKFYFSSLFNKSRFEDKIDKKLKNDVDYLLKKMKYINKIIINYFIELLLLTYYIKIEKREFYIKITNLKYINSIINNKEEYYDKV